MMLWPRTENLGLGTKGDGRGIKVVVSRNSVLCLDMLGCGEMVSVQMRDEARRQLCRSQSSEEKAKRSIKRPTQKNKK